MIEDEPTESVTENGKPGIADAVASVLADRKQGVLLDSWRAQIGLLRHQLASKHAKCWPSRTRIRRARSVINAMEKMYLRIEIAEKRGRMTKWLGNWYGFRFASWSVPCVLLTWLLPRCWCSKKEESDVG